MKKKLISIVIIVVLTVTAIMLTRVNSISEDFSKWLKSNVYSNYEDLKSEFKNRESLSGIADYLYDWGNTNGFESKKLGNNNIKITKNASPNYKDVPGVIIQSNISLDNLDKTSQCASIALSALKGSLSLGKVTLIFTPSVNGDFRGAKAIQKEDLTEGYLISLQYNNETQLITKSSSSLAMNINDKITYDAPEGVKAYKVSLSGLKGKDMGDLTTDSVNPVTVLSNFMSKLNTAGMYFTYVDFNSNGSANNLGTNATVTLVFDESTSTKFEAKAEAEKEKIVDKYYNKNQDIKFKYDPVKLPDKVINYDDGLRILGTLYAIVDGNYNTSKDDGKGDILSLSNVGKITTNNGYVNIDIGGRSILPIDEENMISDYSKAADLSNMNFSTVSAFPSWEIGKANNLNKKMESACKKADISGLEATYSFHPSEIVYFQNENPKLSEIIFGVNNSESFEQSKALLYFLKELKK